MESDSSYRRYLFVVCVLCMAIETHFSVFHLPARCCMLSYPDSHCFGELKCVRANKQLFNFHVHLLMRINKTIFQTTPVSGLIQLLYQPYVIEYMMQFINCHDAVNKSYHNIYLSVCISIHRSFYINLSRTHTAAWIHIYIQTYIRTYAHTYIHTYMCMSVCSHKERSNDRQIYIYINTDRQTG